MQPPRKSAALPPGNEGQPPIYILRPSFDRADTFIVCRAKVKTTMSRNELKQQYASVYLRWLEDEAFGGKLR
jgi:hypothetical protein